jgi:hypothetical protein
VSGLPRAPSVLANDAVVAWDGPHPPDVLGAVDREVRASSFSPAVPPACHKERVTSGMQRTVTVNWRRPFDWAHVVDLGWGRRPKLHGMQALV